MRIMVDMVDLYIVMYLSAPELIDLFQFMFFFLFNLQ